MINRMHMERVSASRAAIPAIDLGRFRPSDKEYERAVRPAIEAGDRHIDTAGENEHHTKSRVNAEMDELGDPVQSPFGRTAGQVGRREHEGLSTDRRTSKGSQRPDSNRGNSTTKTAPIDSLSSVADRPGGKSGLSLSEIQTSPP